MCHALDPQREPVAVDENAVAVEDHELDRGGHEGSQPSEVIVGIGYSAMID